MQPGVAATLIEDGEDHPRSQGRDQHYQVGVTR